MLYLLLLEHAKLYNLHLWNCEFGSLINDSKNIYDDLKQILQASNFKNLKNINMESNKKEPVNKKQSKYQTKVAQVMHEFKEGELHSGKSDVIVTNPKQAIAIALSEAEGLDKKTKK